MKLSAIEPATARRRAVRSVRWLFQHTYGSRLVRSRATSHYESGFFALGEKNHNLFPFRFVTLDFSDADFNLRLDPNVRLPFQDQSQTIGVAAHVLEHCDPETLDVVLHEVVRVLKVGGGFRIEVPDSEALLRAYDEGDSAALEYFRTGRAELIERLGLPEKYLEDQLTVVGEMASYIDHDRRSGHIPVYVSREEFVEAHTHGIDALNDLAQSKLGSDQRLSGGHNNALYYTKLREALLRAGFSRVERASYGKTSIEGLRLARSGTGNPWRVPQKPHRDFFTLYVEAFR